MSTQTQVIDVLNIRNKNLLFVIKYLECREPEYLIDKNLTTAMVSSVSISCLFFRRLKPLPPTQKCQAKCTERSRSVIVCLRSGQLLNAKYSVAGFSLFHESWF
jgi:hypothetical protein